MAGLFFLRKPSKKKRKAPAPAEPAPILSDAESSAPYESARYESAFGDSYQPVALAPYSDELPDGLPGVPDLYAIVGVDPLASDEVIRYAYRRKAARLHERRWRPGQAVRLLAELNAAYEILGNPDRRADYDRRRARLAALASANGAEENGHASAGRGLPSGQRHRGRRLRLTRPGGLIEVLVIVAVIGLALYAASTVLSTRSLVDLSWIVDIGETFGIKRRSAPTPVPTPVAAPESTVVTQGLPAPSSALAAAVPTAAPESTPTPEPTSGPAAQSPATSGPGGRFAGSAARVSDPAPARGTEVTVSARVVRDGNPVPGAQVYAVAHFKTVDERWPPGSQTLPTSPNGEAAIAFNIGDATPGYPVNVDVIARAADEQVQLQTSFTPR